MLSEIRTDHISQLADFTEDHYINVILSEHPELKYLWEHRYKLSSPIVINDTNPVLHVLLESIVEKQVQTENPPKAKETVERLVKEGFSNHAARAAVASLLVIFIFRVLKEKKPFDLDNYVHKMALLGHELGKVGRNEPCPCGSGKKYKKCCEEFKEDLKVDHNAGMLVLGEGAYAAKGYLLGQTPENPIVQMENRYHIAMYLAENGYLQEAVAVLKENIACAEQVNEEGWLKNALHDLEDLCLNYKELYHEGLLVIAKLMSLAKTDEEMGFCRCDRADMLAVVRGVDEAEKEFQKIFSELPDWHFGRYRYALFLESLGRTEEAIKVLQALIAEGDRIDWETIIAARDVLENLTEPANGTIKNFVD